jgi:hypothetical protein
MATSLISMGGGGGGGCKTNSPSSSKRHSFEPDTQVQMADGTTRPIEDVNIGDEVVATDPETGATVAKPVTLLHRNIDKDLTDLTVRNKETGEVTTLHTTQHHPFWNETEGEWTDAKDLTAGTELQVLGEGRVVVEAVRSWDGSKEMRDLTVADIHTYYVIAGDTPVLVHNCDGPLFRGTTPDYAGSPGTQRVGVTPTSTDPGVATIFATHSENYGAGVVQIAHPGSVAGVPRYPGYIAAEAEVGLEISPLDFAARADITIPASAARSILADMGISIPRRIGIEDLSGLLENTPKLTADQITAFVQAAANHGR